MRNQQTNSKQSQQGGGGNQNDQLVLDALNKNQPAWDYHPMDLQAAEERRDLARHACHDI